ncbi:MAG: hypothetical protein ACI8XO_004766 [Verrucomicrobiales bacterium]
MKPASRFLYALAAWAIVGLLASVWPQFALLWQWGGVILGIAVVVDAFLLLGSKISIDRKLPSRCALGVETEIELTVHNRAGLCNRVTVFDGIPIEAEAREQPWEGTVRPGGFTTVIYPIKLLRRGRISFTRTSVKIRSLLGLWDRQFRAGEPGHVRVYPNYEPVVSLALLSIENLENQMGIVRKNHQGLSRDFHQLRDYNEGDTLNQVDWKASSKRQHLISREYEEQRDQNIVLMLDSGSRMRALDGELPQFDHCLNAMLLLAFTALRQGDNVGVMGFGGTDRWLPPVKGEHAMTTILNHLYDYETTPAPSDFAEAAEKLLIRQRRRALVIILTNLRSEDSEHVIPSLQLIRQKHLVLLASLRENSLQIALDKPIDHLEQALDFTSTHLYLKDRQEAFEKIESHGVLTLDETAQKFPISLANEYLNIKAQGRL